MEQINLNKGDDQSLIKEAIFECLLGMIQNKSNYSGFYLSSLENIADKISETTASSKYEKVDAESQNNAKEIFEIYSSTSFNEMTAKSKKQVGKAVFDYLGLDDESGVTVFGQDRWIELKKAAKRRFEPSKLQISLLYIKKEIIPPVVGMTAFAFILAIAIKITNGWH